MKAFCIVLIFILLFSFSFCAFADNYADINNDSFVDIRDVIVMKKMILNNKNYVSQGNYDIVDNSVGKDYNATDLANLISYILGVSDHFSPYDSVEELYV